ncbi:MAG: hypothetical protein JSU98_17270, partial [Gemmatimonadales bacterium]
MRNATDSRGRRWGFAALLAACLSGCGAPAPGPAPGRPAAPPPETVAEPGAPGAETPRNEPEDWDVLLVGGRLVDGSGNPWRYADVAILGDRIAAVLPPGTADRARARSVLDVAGRVVAPGFIDINGQGDYGLLRDGRAR